MSVKTDPAGSWPLNDPAARTFPDLVRMRMTSPDRVFIRNEDGRDLTFGDYWDLSGRLAGALVEAGAQPGDRIAVQVEKSPEVLALFLACARAGLIFLPLNPAYTLAELDYFLGDATPSVIVASPDRAGALSDLGGRHGAAATLSLGVGGDGTLMGAAATRPVAFADTTADWDAVVAILYTSGTTGRSKGAMLTHGNLASNALALVETWRFTERDVLLHALPVYHTHGLFTATNTVLLSGGTMLFRSRFDADEALRLLPQATTMMGVPTFYTRLLKHPGVDRRAVSTIRLFVSGSAPLLPETHAAFAARTGHAILERYGMTETNMNTSNPYDGERRAGTVGLPLAGVEVRVTAPDTGEPLGRDAIGMLEIRGPNVCKGYWRQPEKTAADFRPDGFFMTGDLGMIDARDYVSIVGRGKDLIITGGLNVYPREVESEIDSMQGVVESAVFGLPHPDLGEAVTAVVVRLAGSAPSQETILQHLQGRLAKFKLPKRVMFLEELPRNAMGKVQKADLRKTYAGLYG